MTGLAVTGWGALSADGGDATALYDDPLPPVPARAYTAFDVREHLGRKGTTFFDRCTSLAIVACGRAIEDSGLRVDDENRARVGVVLGTTVGSFKSTSDYSRETLVQDRPYLVNPVLFPNTVMNCASGQTAIWYGLKGVNATIAGAQLGFLYALRYAANARRAGYADALLAGAAEELTPHTAWSAFHSGAADGAGAGEGAAVFVLEDPVIALAAGRGRVADVLSVTVGFAPGGLAGGGIPAALAGCVGRALAQADVPPGDLALVVTGAGGSGARDVAERAGVDLAVGPAVERLDAKEMFGECQAATTALGLAALLRRHLDGALAPGAVSLLTSCTPDGGVGAAVVRGWGRAGADRG